MIECFLSDATMLQFLVHIWCACLLDRGRLDVFHGKAAPCNLDAGPDVVVVDQM